MGKRSQWVRETGTPCPLGVIPSATWQGLSHRVRSTRLQVRGECTASQRQLDNVDKSRRRLLVLRAVAACTGRPAARLLDVRGRCRVPPPRRFQRRRRRRLLTRLVQRDAVVLRRLPQPAAAPSTLSVGLQYNNCNRNLAEY